MGWGREEVEVEGRIKFNDMMAWVALGFGQRLLGGKCTLLYNMGIHLYYKSGNVSCIYLPTQFLPQLVWYTFALGPIHIYTLHALHLFPQVVYKAVELHRSFLIV